MLFSSSGSIAASTSRTPPQAPPVQLSSSLRGSKPAFLTALPLTAHNLLFKQHFVSRFVTGLKCLLFTWIKGSPRCWKGNGKEKGKKKELPHTHGPEPGQIFNIRPAAASGFVEDFLVFFSLQSREVASIYYYYGHHLSPVSPSPSPFHDNSVTVSVFVSALLHSLRCFSQMYIDMSQWIVINTLENVKLTSAITSH